MHLEKSLLEDWMRRYYFTTTYDLGSSGVLNFSIEELFALIGLEITDLNHIRFDDSNTFGNHELRQRIADRWGDGNPSSVLVGNGSNEIIFFLLNALLSTDDEVITLSPIYHTLGKLTKSLGCNVKEWTLNPLKNFQPDLEDLKKIISSKTRMVVVNFPHNPTGVSLTNDQLNELINIVSKVNAYLVWDAAFEGIVYNGNPLPNPYLSYSKTVYIGTVSKSYGLAGLRIGWCISDPKIINKCDVIKDYTSLYVSPLNEFIGVHAIKNIYKIMASIIPRVKENYHRLEYWLNEHSDEVCGNLPDGGVSVFLKILRCDNTHLFCENLAIKEKVLLVPGKCFEHPEYVRIGFGTSPEYFQKGLDILSRSISAREVYLG